MKSIEHQPPIAALLWCVAACASCGSSNVGQVAGRVTVDGAPVDLGTIQFKPAANPGARGAGAAIQAGGFSLGAGHGFVPGTYSVVVQAMKNSGQIFRDPQRGNVPVMYPLELIDSPKDVDVTNENASSLEISFTTKKS